MYIVCLDIGTKRGQIGCRMHSIKQRKKHDLFYTHCFQIRSRCRKFGTSEEAAVFVPFRAVGTGWHLVFLPMYKKEVSRIVLNTRQSIDIDKLQTDLN